MSSKRKSPQLPTPTQIKELRAKLTQALAAEKSTRNAAALAKAEMKRARKSFKQARKDAKEARRAAKHAKRDLKKALRVTATAVATASKPKKSRSKAAPHESSISLEPAASGPKIIGLPAPTEPVAPVETN